VRPSRRAPDEYLTQTLKSALALVDVRVLDHWSSAATSGLVRRTGPAVTRPLRRPAIAARTLADSPAQAGLQDAQRETAALPSANASVSRANSTERDLFALAVRRGRAAARAAVPPPPCASAAKRASASATKRPVMRERSRRIRRRVALDPTRACRSAVPASGRRSCASCGAVLGDPGQLDLHGLRRDEARGGSRCCARGARAGCAACA